MHNELQYLCDFVIVVAVCGYICRFFEIKDKNNAEEAAKLFSVPDFIGDSCKAIASRIRGAVAAVQFDEFHKVSAVLFLMNCKCL